MEKRTISNPLLDQEIHNLVEENERLYKSLQKKEQEIKTLKNEKEKLLNELADLRSRFTDSVYSVQE